MDLSLLGVAGLSRQTGRIRWATATAAVAGVAALDYLTARDFKVRTGMNPPDRGDTRGAVWVHRSLVVNRSPGEVYGIWRDFENLPRFISHLSSIKTQGGNRSHWVIQGPAGAIVEWDAEIVEDRRNELIAWRSLPNAGIDHSGSVRFEPAPGNRGTIVRVELLYRPPAGKAGAAVARWLGQSPEQQIGADLRRFKQRIETGEIARTEGQPAGRPRSTSRKYDDLVRG